MVTATHSPQIPNCQLFSISAPSFFLCSSYPNFQPFYSPIHLVVWLHKGQTPLPGQAESTFTSVLHCYPGPNLLNTGRNKWMTGLRNEWVSDCISKAQSSLADKLRFHSMEWNTLSNHREHQEDFLKGYPFGWLRFHMGWAGPPGRQRRPGTDGGVDSGALERLFPPQLWRLLHSTSCLKPCNLPLVDLAWGKPRIHPL